MITAEKLERARTIIGKGLTVREAAVRIKVGKTALYEALSPASAAPINPQNLTSNNYQNYKLRGCSRSPIETYLLWPPLL